MTWYCPIVHCLLSATVDIVCQSIWFWDPAIARIIRVELKRLFLGPTSAFRPKIYYLCLDKVFSLTVNALLLPQSISLYWILPSSPVLFFLHSYGFLPLFSFAAGCWSLWVFVVFLLPRLFVQIWLMTVHLHVSTSGEKRKAARASGGNNLTWWWMRKSKYRPFKLPLMKSKKELERAIKGIKTDHLNYPLTKEKSVLHCLSTYI